MFFAWCLHVRAHTWKGSCMRLEIFPLGSAFRTPTLAGRQCIRIVPDEPSESSGDWIFARMPKRERRLSQVNERGHTSQFIGHQTFRELPNKIGGNQRKSAKGLHPSKKFIFCERRSENVKEHPREGVLVRRIGLTFEEFQNKSQNFVGSPRKSANSLNKSEILPECAAITGRDPGNPGCSGT